MVFVACAAQSAAPSCGDRPSAAPPPILPRSVADERYEPLRGFDRALSLGVGHLRPARDEDRDDWLDFVLLPLAERPGGPVTLWLAGGWVVPLDGRAARRVGIRGTVETGYETVSLIVLEANKTGWLRIRFAPENESSSTGWLHRCDVEKLRPSVIYEPWERFFAQTNASLLYFRTGGPRALRRAPESGAEPVAWIPAEGRKYAFEPLEFKGDWMRARLRAPFDQCRKSHLKPRVREGWIRWRDPALGPLLWYFTRGC
jgi:hypothetical protein